MTVEQDYAYFGVLIKIDIGRGESISNAIPAMPKTQLLP